MEELHEEIARDPVRQARYQRELARLQLANQIVKLREARGLSQAGLAKRIGTHQSVIARMERGDYRGYTVSTLAKIAAATGVHLDIRFVRDGRPRLAPV